MDGQIIVQWLTPALLGGFGLAFAALWRSEGRAAAGFLAASYASAAVAFAVELSIINTSTVSVGSIVEDAFYLAAAAFLAAGLARQFGRSIPWVPIVMALSVGAALYAWHSIARPDFGARTLWLSLCVAAIMARASWAEPDRAPSIGSPAP